MAIEYLHSLQIVYRDLKPENVMIDDEGYVRLIDLGASKLLQEQGGRTFTLTGTPIYMAPEVIEGKGYSYSADLWSLGILLYESLCGPAPYGDADDPMQILDNIMNKELQFPSSVTGKKNSIFKIKIKKLD